MIRAVIFDFAGVLGTDGYWEWLRENVPDLEQHRETLHNLSVQADVGQITAEEFMRRASARIGTQPDLFRQGFLAKTVINHALVSFIEGLKPRYKTGLLSNFVFEWLDPILTTHQLYRLFDVPIISSSVKMVKPEARIFHLVCAKLQVAPAEAIFVDDRTMHIDGARQAGLHAVLYTDVTTLRQALLQHGVS